VHTQKPTPRVTEHAGRWYISEPNTLPQGQGSLQLSTAGAAAHHTPEGKKWGCSKSAFLPPAGRGSGPQARDADYRQCRSGRGQGAATPWAGGGGACCLASAACMIANCFDPCAL